MFKKDLKPEIIQSFCEETDKALQFIADVKWEKGFVCHNCGHTNYCAGKTVASRRCTRCKKEESATAHTIFHNCKFPVNKAFYIVYMVCLQKRKVSANDLSMKLGINQMTCWKFRKKIKECIDLQQKNPNNNVELLDILMSKKD
ncbi:MAG: transposase [Paludibacteraceae bacterium]